MDMFDGNFSFDAPLRSPSIDSISSTSTRELSRSVSPCSPTSVFPAPRFSVTDLAATFATSRLLPDAQICYDSCETYANLDDDAGWEIPPPEDISHQHPTSRPRALPSRPHSPSRRRQRQMNTRLLCSTSHAKDVAQLVTRMVECKDQCTILGSEPIVAESEEDEGYDSSDAHSPSESQRISSAMSRARLEFRRSSDMTKGACVSKAVRLRKRKDHRRIKSADSES